MKFLIILFIIICCSGNVTAQKTMYRTMGHQTQGSEGRNAIQAADGGYFLTYYIYLSGTFIGCLTKLNCAGEVEWERFFTEAFSALPVDVIPQEDNGCLLLLSVRIVTGEYQAAVIRVDEQGNNLWTQRINIQPANATGCIAQHNDGSIYVCGASSIPGTGYTGTAIAKLNTSGQLLWMKQYGEYLDHSPRVITVTGDHKIAVAGNVGITSASFTNVFVFIVDENGNFIKRKVLSTFYDDEPHSICADNIGNICVTGYSYFLSSEWDMFFLKLDGNLNILQSKCYDGGTAQGEQARYITHAANNTFAIFGDEGGFNDRNPMMMKLDANGIPIWAKRYTISPQYTNYLFHGTQCTDGGFLMTGDARPVNQFRIAPFIKTDENGEMGCFTATVSLTVRNEPFATLDSSLLEYSLPIQSNTMAVPYFGSPVPTGNMAFCQSLVPCGNFVWTLDTLCPDPCFTFTATASFADTWLWTFENGTPASSANQQPPQVCYSSEGPHEIRLTLSNPAGSVTYTKMISPVFDCPFIIPNIFTPNNDGINDIFKAENLNEPFALKIFNRWGMELFASQLPGTWWNGNSSNGKHATSGVYYYILTLPGSSRVFKGTVELIR